VGSRSRARARAQASQEAANHASAPQPGASRRDAEQPPVPPAGQPPRTVRALAAIQGVEALGVLAASILAAVDTGSGKSYQLGSGIAITLIGACTALLLGLVARGVLAGRRWSRTPALLTQLFTGIVAIYLLQAPRYEWGIPALLLALAGIAMVFAPASMQLLTPGRIDKADPR
jgi:hypothetical protein